MNKTPSIKLSPSKVFALALINLVLVFSLVRVQPVYAGGGEWALTGSLNDARTSFTTTVLQSGLVLAVGGSKDNMTDLSSAELYDPATEKWTLTGSLNTARELHTATLLQNGKVLVVGGLGQNILSGAELYNPVTGKWTRTESLHTSRHSHTATLLPDGRVLVVGGWNLSGGGQPTRSAELYNPNTEKWTNTGLLNTARYNHTAVLLPNGKVLVVGGNDPNPFANAELFDPSTGQWTYTSPLSFPYVDNVTLLKDGRVLVIGGSSTTSGAEIYDPSTDEWTPTNPSRNGHFYIESVVLPDGQVLLAGGDSAYPNPLVELYNPETGIWSITNSLNYSRDEHTVTLLPNNQILVAGGWDRELNKILSAELYTPSLSKTFTSSGEYDGWLSEHSENSNIGGALNSSNVTVNIGDNAADKQYRAILSFNTASLPNNAIITKVTIRLKLQSVVGNNPFNTHGNLAVDVMTGSFGGNVVLEKTDFQATASKNAVGVIPNNPVNGWYTRTWTAGIVSYINKSGVTQIRLRFQKDDDDDLTADYLKFFSGNSATNARPVLIIEYYVP